VLFYYSRGELLVVVPYNYTCSWNFREGKSHACSLGREPIAIRRCVHIKKFIKELQDISDEVHLTVCCRFADEKRKKNIGEHYLCCLTVRICATAQTVFDKLNQLVEKHCWDWEKYLSVANCGEATRKVSQTKLFGKKRKLS